MVLQWMVEWWWKNVLFCDEICPLWSWSFTQKYQKWESTAFFILSQSKPNLDNTRHSNHREIIHHPTHHDTTNSNYMERYYRSQKLVVYIHKSKKLIESHPNPTIVISLKPPKYLHRTKNVKTFQKYHKIKIVRRQKFLQNEIY